MNTTRAMTFDLPLAAVARGSGTVASAVSRCIDDVSKPWHASFLPPAKR
ncbi:MAG: hypothetical protein LBS59_07050 [Puniceicoccales bacterium]|nr:hypothetical protein [Puniceicoccales bacterium]